MKLINLIAPNINFSELRAWCQPEDAILLRQDAVMLCLNSTITWPAGKVYVLQMDAQVRQLSVPSGFELISAERWVALAIAAKVNLLWQS